MHLIEPYLAFDDPDYSLQTVLAASAGRPVRACIPSPGCASSPRPRPTVTVTCGTKLTSIRSTARWRVGIWAEEFVPSDDESLARGGYEIREGTDRASARRVARLRARGVKVLFVRMPSTGPFLEFEDRMHRERGPGTRCSAPPGRRAFISRTIPSCRATTCRSGRIWHVPTLERFTAALVPDHRTRLLGSEDRGFRRCNRTPSRRAERARHARTAQWLARRRRGPLRKGSSPSRAACG